MSLSQSPSSKVGSSPAIMPHLQSEASCPTCGQAIPHDHFDEIKARIDARQSAREAQITARLREDFALQKDEAVEKARQEAAATAVLQVASARAEERTAAQAAADQKIKEATRANQETLTAMQAKIELAETSKTTALAQIEQMRRDNEEAIKKVKQDAEANAATIREEAKKTAEAGVQEKIAGLERARQESEDAKAIVQQSNTDLHVKIDQMRLDNEETIKKVQQDAEADAATIRQEAKKIAEAGVQEQIAGLERARQESEDAKAIVQQANSDLQAKISQMRVAGDAAIESVRQEADARVNAARQEAVAATESAMKTRLTGAEQAKADAEAKLLVSEQEKLTLQEAHNSQLQQRLQEQREALEGAQTAAVNAEKQAAFDRELKLQTKLEDMQRTLDNKTAEELGEGAELDLFEVLKSECDGDKIERINKGQPGADILHTVIHNGRECGIIIYDSKNHNGWRNEFVTKLASDQMAAKADHAVLSTRKFPSGKRHLHVQDGVILATPARVAALVQIIRQHIVQTHTLRLSEESRTQKTAELYAFITSPRCHDLLVRIDTHTDDLLDLQVKDKKAHDTMWKKQGELIRSVQKVRAEISSQIDGIIGSSGDVAGQVVNE